MRSQLVRPNSSEPERREIPPLGKPYRIDVEDGSGIHKWLLGHIASFRSEADLLFMPGGALDMMEEGVPLDGVEVVEDEPVLTTP